MATGFHPFLSFSLLAALAAGQDPAAARAWLEDGNRRFQQGEPSPARLDAGARRTAAARPEPRAIVLTCCDADVPPEHLFQAGLGDLVVLRLAGPSIDAEALADVERAADGLRVPLLVVLAHDHCRAADRAVRLAAQAAQGAPGSVPSAAVQHLLQQFEPSVRSGLEAGLSGEELQAHVETDRAVAVAAECLRRSETLRRLQRLGRFQSLPARYRRDTGAVEFLVPRVVDVTPQELATVVEAEPPAMAPHVALRLLQAGNRRYLGSGKPLGDVSPARRTQATEAQPPFAIVVSCSDSRVPPEHLFDCGLGELAVVRTAGPTLGDAALGSIELTCSTTGSPLLVVLGHADCSALAEAARPADPSRTENVRALVDRVAPSLDGRREDLRAAAVANALRTTAALRQRSALLQRLEDEGRLLLIPAVYDVATGDVEWLAEQPASRRPQAAPAGETGGEHGSASHDPTRTHGDSHAEPTGDGHGGAPATGHGDDHAAASPEQHGQTAHGTSTDHAPTADNQVAATTGSGHGSSDHDSPGAGPAPAGGHDGAHGAHGTQTHGDQHGGAGNSSSGHSDTTTDPHAEPQNGDSHEEPHGAPHGTSTSARSDLSWAEQLPVLEPMPHAGAIKGSPDHGQEPNAPAAGGGTAFGGKPAHWATVAMLAVTAIASFALALVVTSQKRS